MSDSASVPGPQATTEGSLLARGVALLSPVFAIAAGWLAGAVARIVPGAHLEPAQVTAFMLAASATALSAAWKWVQGWQQHELLVAQGKVSPIKAAPLVDATVSTPAPASIRPDLKETLMSTLPASPGDVLAVWTGDGVVEDVIRLGELLQGKPAVANHVVVITHLDQLGRWIGIQGQPGGVGVVDCTPYLSDSRTRSNHDQPKPDDHGQLATFLASAAKSLGIGYDWAGIAEDAAAALHVEDLSAQIDHLWRWRSGNNLLPGHVVCSSLAAILYDIPSVGWVHPDLGTERMCEPADWWRWSDTRAWDAAGPSAQ